MKSEPNNVLIRDYVEAQVQLTIKTNNTHYSTKKLQESIKKMEQELLRREILTKEDIDFLNS